MADEMNRRRFIGLAALGPIVPNAAVTIFDQTPPETSFTTTYRAHDAMDPTAGPEDMATRNELWFGDGVTPGRPAIRYFEWSVTDAAGNQNVKRQLQVKGRPPDADLDAAWARYRAEIAR